MGLYTVVMSYRGGTFVSQSVRRNLDHFLSALGETIAWNALGNATSEAVRREFLKDIIDDVPVLLEGMKNVWCASALLDDSIAILHVVKTEMPA